MGLLGFLFGSGSDAYSTQARNLSEYEVHHLVSRAHITTLTAEEQHVIHDAILRARGGDGFVSMRQIDLALQHLVSQGKISKNDHWAVRAAFKHFFAKQ